MTASYQCRLCNVLENQRGLATRKDSVRTRKFGDLGENSVLQSTLLVSASVENLLSLETQPTLISGGIVDPSSTLPFAGGSLHSEADT